MRSIEVSTMGFKINVPVPESTEEYNTLAPKRENAVLEDAIKYQVLHGTNGEFRPKFVDELEKLTGIERINHGTEEEPQWESDGKFFKRLAAASGVDIEAFRASHAATAQKIYDTCKFDPSATERTGEGPKIAKGDMKLAAETIARGGEKTTQIAAQLSKIIGREVAVDEKSLARAFGDWRRKRDEEAAAQRRAEIGL